jgi:transcriptional regulator with XRE-family HTH domain
MEYGAMKRPDAKWHRPEPAYLRELLERAGLSQRGAARVLGLTDRTMRHYASGDHPMPYPVQYCLEVLAAAGPAGTGDPE